MFDTLARAPSLTASAHKALRLDPPERMRHPSAPGRHRAPRLDPPERMRHASAPGPHRVPQARPPRAQAPCVSTRTSPGTQTRPAQSACAMRQHPDVTGHPDSTRQSACAMRQHPDVTGHPGSTRQSACAMRQHPDVTGHPGSTRQSACAMRQHPDLAGPGSTRQSAGAVHARPGLMDAAGSEDNHPRSVPSTDVRAVVARQPLGQPRAERQASQVRACPPRPQALPRGSFFFLFPESRPAVTAASFSSRPWSLRTLASALGALPRAAAPFPALRGAGSSSTADVELSVVPALLGSIEVEASGRDSRPRVEALCPVPMARVVNSRSGSGTEPLSRVNLTSPAKAEEATAVVWRRRDVSRRGLPALCPKSRKQVRQGQSPWAQGCERGVRIPLVSLHAPVTGRPAVSRGQGAVRGATRVARAGPGLARSEVEH